MTAVALPVRSVALPSRAGLISRPQPIAGHCEPRREAKNPVLQEDMQVSALSDRSLVASLKRLVAREREVVADVIEHLAEVDARQLFLDYPCSSLSAYCVQALGYSEYSAAHRVTAARLVRR